MTYALEARDEGSRSSAVRAPESNLPLQLTSFVGRESAMAEVTRLFANARVMTLSGPGGCGKTRLALQVAPRLAGATGKLAWVDLAPLTDDSLIPQAIARALDLPNPPGTSLIDAIIAAVRARPLLLMLDSCEHLIDAVAELAELLLRQSDDLQLLVTSREALNIAGETAWNVPPLTLPATTDRLAALMQSEAGRLFVERATSALPTFVPTDDDVPAIADICHRLDGMPLAIELAASRVRLLDVREIAERLADSFRLLTAGRRTALPRHQTLRTAIDWSYELLSQSERRLFERLSVFAGGFSLATAEAICATDGLDEDDILDLLGHLVDKSLVVAQATGQGTRYRLLETIRQFSLEKRAAHDPNNDVRARHARWYRTLVESGHELEGDQQAAWIDLFEREHDNFRAAMQWARDNGDAETLGRMSVALWRFWLIRGYLREGSDWLQAALQRAPDETLLRAGLLQGAAVLTCHQADYRRARTLFDESRRIALAFEDTVGLGEALYGLATVAQFQGEYRRALDDFEQSLAVSAHPRGRALALMGMAMTALYLGDPERATELCIGSLTLCRAVGDDRSAASALTSLGIIAVGQSDLEEAERVCTASLTIRRRVGDRGGIAHTLTVLGGIALERDDVRSATSYYREALALRRDTGDIAGSSGPLEGLGATAIVARQPRRGAFLLAAADATRERFDTPPTPIERQFRDRFHALLRGQLNQTERAALSDEARDTPLDAVIAEALRLPFGEEDAEPKITDRSVVAPTPEDHAELQIFAFGTVRILRGGVEIDARAWTYAKSRQMLLYLLGFSPATKEQIGAALWPDASSEQLRNAFHAALHHLRRTLGDGDWIVFQNGCYAFNRVRPFCSDVDTFEEEITEARRLQGRDPDTAILLLERAVARHTGKYLVNQTEAEWHLARQDELERRYLDSLLLLADLQLARGSYDAAATSYRQAVFADDYLEAAHRGVMRCFAHLGERGLALRHYRSFAARLRADLGSEPADQTHALFERLQHGAEID